jgi:hypothetical protein
MLAELAMTDPAARPAAKAKLALISAPRTPAPRTLRLVTPPGDEPSPLPIRPTAPRSMPPRED